LIFRIFPFIPTSSMATGDGHGTDDE